MGFLSKKKDKDADEESTRSSLFGRRKEKSSPAPAQNPYAAPAAKDPYGAPPPSYSSAGGGDSSYRQEKTPAVTGPGGSYGQRPGGFGAQGGSYGAQSGYGNDQYGGESDNSRSQRPGGYGGLGRTTSGDTMSTDVGRNELFGNAPQRVQAQRDQPGQSGAYGDSGQSGAYGAAPPGGYGSSSGAYGAYGDRELTAEEQEEEDISATKDQIRDMKRQDVSSTMNALRLAAQAEETGRDTLARLGAQGERLHNTERNLDLAYIGGRQAADQTKTLERVNASMMPQMHMPFSKKGRYKEQEAKAMERHQSDRATREATTRAAWETSARQDEFKRSGQQSGQAVGKKSLAKRAEYQFEADSEDDEMENQIDNNLDLLHGAAQRLNQLSRAMGTEADAQNKQIDEVTRKTDKVDDQIHLNQTRLGRIR